jgi:catechol 2,3-dioxygenase-like lactoylglutathione lyase family enzyme
MEVRLTVKRIVPNITATNVGAADEFYRSTFGLNLLMDMGWIRTYGLDIESSAQVSVMTDGGSGTPVPDMSIEVDNLDVVLEELRRKGIPIEYGPCLEPWGVRRFYVRDPFGRLVNVLEHER